MKWEKQNCILFLFLAFIFWDPHEQKYIYYHTFASGEDISQEMYLMWSPQYLSNCFTLNQAIVQLR